MISLYIFSSNTSHLGFAVELLENSDTLLTLGYNTNQQLELIQSVIEYTSIHIDATKDIRSVLDSLIKDRKGIVGILDTMSAQSKEIAALQGKNID